MNAELEQPEIWNTPEKAQALGKERASLELVVNTIKALDQGIEDVEGLIELAVEAEDSDTFQEAQAEADQLEEKLAKLECLVAHMMRQIAMLIYRQDQAGQKRKTGQKCCSECIYAGRKVKDLKLN